MGSLDRHNCEQQHVKNLKRAFVCNDCGKRFTSKKQMEPHIYQQHTRKYPCKRCGLCFESNEAMKLHSNKPWGCQNFNSNNHYDKAMSKAGQQTQAIVDSFKHVCNFCSNVFSRDHDLKRHLHLNTMCSQEEGLIPLGTMALKSRN